MVYAVEIRNLVKNYKAFTALDGISFNIEQGDIVGYVGPNGAGKTTTIKILTTLLKPTSGHVYINGADVTKRSREMLRDIGALIEVPGIYDYLTPAEMLSYFGKIYRMPINEIEKQTKETLGLLKLSDWEHKKIGTFSTGMQRRLAIAKAIFHKPKIIILDEPVLGLDPEGIRDIRELIKKFNSEGVTIFLSSHLLGEVAAVCKKVIFIDKGRITDYDSVDNISTKNISKVIDVKFLKPLSKEELIELEKIELIKSIKANNESVLIGFDGKQDTSSQILKRIMSLGYEIASFNIESIELEDYYLSIMSEEKEGNR